MPSNRRSFLLGSSAVATSLSGCLDVFRSNDDTVGLTLYNYTGESRRLKIEILSENANSDSGGSVFAREFTITPPQEDESAGVVRESNIVPRRRYLVRVLLHDGNGRWHHHHFYPGESDRFTVRIYRDEETGSLYVRFR